MGMSASQARFLCLTARKNNVEFEGQQINQQRTTLSNESASYYSELCNMSVPVPPSVDDYTKVSYTFNDGAMTNTVTSLLYSSTEDAYHINYLQQWQDDYSIVPASSSLVQASTIGAGGTGGSSSITSASGALANISMASPEVLAASGSTATYSIGGVTLRLLGTGPDGSTPTTPTVTPTSTPTETPTPTPTTTPGSTTKEYVDVNGDGTGDYEVFYDEDGKPYYNDGTSGGLSAYERSMIKFYYQTGAGLELAAFVGNDGKIYRDDDIWQTGSIFVDQNDLKTNSSIIIATEDESHNVSLLHWTDGDYVKLDDDGNEITSGKHYITDPSTIIQVEVPSGSASIAMVSPSVGMAETGVVAEEDAVYIPEDEETGISYTAPTTLYSSTSTGDDYWNSLTSEQQTQLLQLEQYYLALLREDCGNDSAEFYVMYKKNTTTGAYEPYFYNKSELESAPATDRGLKSVAAYSVGSETKTKEVLNQKCSVEQDSSGRYIAITVKFDNGEEKTYQLNTTTTTDEEAYNDAMNDYYYQQHEYDHKIQEINAKLEIIQQQDKQLELKLKQLDTEENAISTEMDAVKKVISKNIDNSFKTFSA